MIKVLVLYYSAYGHVETMAYAEAEGARSAGAKAVVKRVPELVPFETRGSPGSSSTSRRRSQASRNFPNTMPSSSARRHASAA
jgi:hypothetical protein